MTNDYDGLRQVGRYFAFLVVGLFIAEPQTDALLQNPTFHIDLANMSITNVKSHRLLTTFNFSLQSGVWNTTYEVYEH